MMDVHVPRAVTSGLRQRGVDVLTAQEDDCNGVDDPALMNRATELDRVLFSQDHDLLREAARRQRSQEEFSGLAYVHQEKLTAGKIINDLEIIAKVYEPEDMRNRVEYLPL